MVFAVLSLMAIPKKSQLADVESPFYIVSQELEVSVFGEVKKPGNYQVKRGTTVAQVLDQAIPNEHANLRRMKLNRKVREGEVIRVHKAKGAT